MQAVVLWRIYIPMEDELPEVIRGRRWRMRYVFGAVLVLILLLLAYAWWQRIDIADRYVRDYLEKNGVRASYQIQDIGFRTQRIRNIVIGDPAKPDLTAKTIDIDLAIGFGRPSLRAIRADGVRVKGRFADGKLYLGELDKLRDMESKEPLALPDINVQLTDALLSLATPWGGVGLSVVGKGNLRNRFDGKLIARSPSLSGAGCTARGVRYNGAVRIRNVHPEFIGPLSADLAACANQKLALASPKIDGKVEFTETFDRWLGEVALSAQSANADRRFADDVSATVAFNGTQQRTDYRLALSQARLRMPDIGARNLAGEAYGNFSFSDAGLALSARGDVALNGASLSPSLLPSMDRLVLGTKAVPLAGTIAERYLVNRSIPLRSSELRYLDRTPLGRKPDVRFLPALIAAVRMDIGIVAIHRTFLDPVTASKADFFKPKRALGQFGAGAIRLADPIDGRLGLAEGTESCEDRWPLSGGPTHEPARVHSRILA